ncbi:MAG: DNA translocase FtsK [Bacteroidia bacterium]|nr:DNA translocase FtsK [Bacteroidia bacterium]MDW8235093.1 DNA translocase FtsK 4TM domain-containing protein [Bacteroidia bacterium]
MESPSSPQRYLLLSAGLGVVGVYVLVAVIAYFLSYTSDLPALEGAPSAVSLNNPTGWIGARIAHFITYKGFGWAGIVLPILMIYGALQWVRCKPIRLAWVGRGLLLMVLLSTFGGWLVQMGWVEDLLWCGSAGAGFTAWLRLYVGEVGLFLLWIVSAGVIGWVAFPRLRFSLPTPPPPPSPPPPIVEPEPELSAKESPSPSWYEVIRVPLSEAPSSASLKGSQGQHAPIPHGQIADIHPAKPAEEIKPSDHLVVSQDDQRESRKLSVEEEYSEPAPIKHSFQNPSDTVSQPEPSFSYQMEEKKPEEPFVVQREGGFPLSLLAPVRTSDPPLSLEELEAQKEQIIRTLRQYGVELQRITAVVGPTVTLFELVPAPGVRISRIKGLEDDIALSLAALGIRIIAPMPGKGTIGIEIPHSRPRLVPLSELLQSPEYLESSAQLPLALGKTITGEAFVRDLTQMPHLLIAGATGQGKSVALNCMILSLLYRCGPEQVRFVLIDPKKVELSLYQELEQHYLAETPGIPERIITDVRQALPVLQSLVREMEMRYELLDEVRVRNISEYNQRCRSGRVPEGHQPLPYIVLIIDELADLMMTAGKEVETPICRLAQLARAVGIHLIVATQRPSVNVITGLIKANFPVRISFRVVTRVDSRVILDLDGAERLMGRGDMLFAMGTELLRLQSGYVSSAEVEQIVHHIKMRPPAAPYVLPEPPLEEREEMETAAASEERDELFHEAALLVVRSGQGSTSLLQRKLGIGFNRAGRLMDQLERAGIVGPARGSKPREVLIQDESQLHALL